MYSNKFTRRAKEALVEAGKTAMQMGHNYIGSEHILYGLSADEESIAGKVLKTNGITADAIKDRIEMLVGVSVPTDSLELGYTPRTKGIIQKSFDEARRFGCEYIGTEHILLSLLRESECIAVRILSDMGANLTDIYTSLEEALNDKTDFSDHNTPGKETPKKNTKTPLLEKYGRDLTKMAKELKLDPVTGRDEEIRRVIQILSRRTKNNPCLIGEPGVGKTAIAEGLAQDIINGRVPENLISKRVITLDLSSMVAGAKYRGEFEERLKGAMDEIRKAGDIILFIDEIHTLIGAGAAEGAIDAANILKPSLARGELQVIGATTIDEYRKNIEKDAALERRFQPVMVDEPTEEQCIEILKSLRDKYEGHHRVKITDDAIVSAVKLSVRYISDRFLPDKAIDLIDEASSRVRLKSLTLPPDLKETENRINELKNEIDEAIKNQEYEKAASIRDEKNSLTEKLSTEKENWKKSQTDVSPEVTKEEIADIISSWTGIPVKSLAEEESEKLLKLEEVLHERVIGQDEAVTAVAKAIRRGRVGLKDPKRPVGSFIFLGPTGVGKTELSKALAEAMFGDEDAMIRIDMSEYMEKFAVSRLVGSPPGYVGHEEGGQLTEKVRRKPYSVILFDEIEKAHPDVFNILLQILDDGILTDSQGRRVDFRNTVIIMTSNLGARRITEHKSLGFSTDAESGTNHEQIKSDVMSELKRAFRPEFLNRVDDTIVFRQLTKTDIEKIAEKMLEGLKKRLIANGIQAEFTENAVSEIANHGFDAVYGARPLRRAIQSEIEDMIAEKLLEGNIKNGDSIKIDFTDGNFII